MKVYESEIDEIWNFEDRACIKRKDNMMTVKQR
jgi:hypothetical protein